MAQKKECSITRNTILDMLTDLQKLYLKLGLKYEHVKNLGPPNNNDEDIIEKKKKRKINFITIGLLIVALIVLYLSFLRIFLSIRCLIPHNYFTWEATRPLSDCAFCSNITQVIDLKINNLTQKEFVPYAYSSKPIVIRNAFLHWEAMKVFNFKFFQQLYAEIDETSLYECQFLHFKSNFISLKDVFAMSEARVQNLPGENSWYVGWETCHSVIQNELKKYFPKPHFLPEDAELTNNVYIFMGYDEGASFHLDFINRLMWQAQLKGSKIWKLLPPPECQEICNSFSFKVHPGDAVLVDTRLWYHATTIPKNQFSLSLHSVYG